MSFVFKDAARGGIASILLSTLAISILSLALPVMTLQVYDRILPNPESGTLPVLIGGVCVAAVLEIVLRLARGYIINWNGAAFDHKVSCDALSHLLFSDLAAAQKSSPGEYLNNLSAIGKMKEFHSGFNIVTLFELVLVPVYLALIYYIAGPLVLVPAAVLVAFSLFASGFGGKLRNDLNSRNMADDRRYDFLLDCLEGMHTVKAFSLEDAFTRRYERIEKSSARINYNTAKDASASFNAASVFGHLMSLLIIAFGAERVLAGDMTSGALIASTLLAGRIMQPVQRALSLWVRYQDYLLSKNKASSLFELPSVKRASLPEPAVEGHVTLKNISFIHSLENSDTFHNVNLDVRPGETIRITGAHGAGKSHLLGLMAGLYLGGEGQVEIDGLDPLNYPYGALRKHIGLLKTKGEIFRGTIRDNLTSFGAVTEDQARKTTRLLGIEREVARLPRGYDTFLGDDAAFISPGLQQRIAIARVMAWDPGIILFDNADRNLDRNGYRAVYKLLVHLQGRKTLILATDDPNFGALASRHMRLEVGGLKDIPAPESVTRPVIARMMEEVKS